MLSNSSKYAIRAVIYIAENNTGERVGIKTIAKALDIPSPFLGKILQVLSHNQLLDSVKGPHGGFSLGRASEEIKLIDIITLFDGTESFKSCLIDTCSCSSHDKEASRCTVHNNVASIRENLWEVFNSQTIHDFVKGKTSVEQVLNLKIKKKTH